MRRREWLGGVLSLVLLPAQAQESDVVLRAMTEELERSRALRIVDLDPPYYIEYSIDDAENVSISATLGGKVDERRDRFRLPRVRVRVGDYKFDNTNYIFSDASRGSRFDGQQMPVEDDLFALRHHLWLTTDRAFKSAVEILARKRSALRNVASTEELNDFAKAEPTRMILPVDRSSVDVSAWRKRIVELSGIFRAYPDVLLSSADFDSVDSIFYFANSEGSMIRIPDGVAYVRVRATGLAPDGMTVRDAAAFHARRAAGLPSELDLRRGTIEVAENVRLLARAPVGESYTGPVLFEARAAAQLFAQVLGGNLALRRRPVFDPGRTFQFPQSELEGRDGSKILPEWIDVVDDPTQTEWRGTPLFGHYPVDIEAVIPQPLTLVEKGELKNYLLTRQPVRGYEGSNGRARLPGSFGANAAGFGNLFIRASETVPFDQLKRQLIELCDRRNKPYGLLIRKLDFPTTASIDELRSLAAATRGATPISPPLLAYRIYPDGREELVRGLRFRGLNVRTLRDILAASDEPYVFDFLNNAAPLAMSGAGGYVTNNSVIAPAVLIDDVELEKVQDELPKLPVVPPPPLSASQ
ncbi:MAG: metallopeptidase TldD-related protein [Bryobacteraceae bacterium]